MLVLLMPEEQMNTENPLKISLPRIATAMEHGMNAGSPIPLSIVAFMTAGMKFGLKTWLVLTILQAIFGPRIVQGTSIAEAA